MAELRIESDRLDRQLIALLTQRATHIDRAVELNPTEGLPARNEAQVFEVKQNIRAEARTQGLDPDLADGLRGQLIEWSIAPEEKILGRDKQEQTR